GLVLPPNAAGGGTCAFLVTVGWCPRNLALDARPLPAYPIFHRPSPPGPPAMRYLLGLLTLVTFALPALSDDKVTLKKGDRIIFLGDSITQSGAGPKGYVTLVKSALKKDQAELKVEVIGAGISGNKVPDLQKRLKRDVIDKKPTVVVIYIGINDVWHG